MFLICAISRRCFCSQLAQALLPTQPRRLHHICLKYCRSTSHFTRTALHTSSVIRQIFIRAKRVSSRSFYADIKHVSLHGVPSFVSPKGLEMIQTKVRRCIHFQTCRFQPPPPPPQHSDQSWKLPVIRSEWYLSEISTGRSRNGNAVR